LQGEYGRRQEAYWLKQFEGEVPILNLPTDYPRPAVQSFEGAKISHRLSPTLSDSIRNRCKQYDVTMFVFLLTAYKVLLCKYSGQDDITVGTSILGRDHSDLEEVIGMFVNVLPIRSNAMQRKYFHHYLKEVKEIVLEGLAHQNHPFETLAERILGKRDISRNPLFDTLFLYNSERERNVYLKGLNIIPESFNSKSSRFDLTIRVMDDGYEAINVTIEYRTHLFKAETIGSLIQHYGQLLNEIVHRPERKLLEIEIVDDSDRVSNVGLPQ
jgi:non-ribosomal peptide synthetase component F